MTAMTNAPPPHIQQAIDSPWGGGVLAGILSAAQLQYITEDDLQAAIKKHLDGVDVWPEREVRLSDGISRIDLIAGRTGIEVKIEGSWGNVLRQLMRYSKCEEIASLVLVTTRAKHHHIPDQLSGKPLHLVSLIGNGL